MKKIVTAAVGAMMLLALAGCSTNGTGSDSSGGAPGPSALQSAKGVTTISFWHGAGGTNAQALTSLINEFNTENAGKIHVNVSGQANYSDLVAKYTASLRGNSMPTVILSPDYSTGYLNDVKRSQSPEKMAAANPGVVDIAKLSSAGKNYFSVDGHLVSVPMNMSTPMLFVNNDLLAKAGVDPSSLKTVDGLAAAAKTITSTTGVPGLTVAFYGWYYEELTAAAGQQYCSPGNGRTGHGATALTVTSPAQVAAFTALNDLFRSGDALNIGEDNNNATTAFVAGKAAMMLNTSSNTGSVEQGATFPYSALPFPLASSSKDAGTVVGGASLWLSNRATAAQQVAGWRLIGFLTSANAQEKFSKQTGYVPVNDEVYNSGSYKTFLADHPAFAAAVDQVRSTPKSVATAGCLTGALPTIRNIIVAQMEAAANGSETMDAALKATTTQANQAISDYREQADQ